MLRSGERTGRVGWDEEVDEESRDGRELIDSGATKAMGITLVPPVPVDLGRSRRLLCRVWTIEDSLCTGRHFFDFRKGNGFCLCEALPSTVPEEDGNQNCNENQGADDTTCQGALADTRG